MGCFLACFGSSKDAKRQKQRIHVFPRDQVSPCYRMSFCFSLNLCLVSEKTQGKKKKRNRTYERNFVFFFLVGLSFHQRGEQPTPTGPIRLSWLSCAGVLVFGSQMIKILGLSTMFSFLSFPFLSIQTELQKFF